MCKTVHPQATSSASSAAAASSATPNQSLLPYSTAAPDSNQSKNMATLHALPTPAPRSPPPEPRPRSHKCPTCDKAFNRLEHQARHIRIHTGDKPYACKFPGCQTRFSRSDELTRHSRIHTDANPRRRYKAAQRSNAKENSATSKSPSPNVSPPHVHSHLQDRKGSANTSGASTPASSTASISLPSNMHMLATAASQQLEREDRAHSAYSGSWPSILSATGNDHCVFAGAAPLEPLTPYNAPTLTSTTRPHDDDMFVRRHSKRSRSNSPVSTAPSSPMFLSSYMPIPAYTPPRIITPAHSPRLHSPELEVFPGVQLPSIRLLSPWHRPPLVTLEVDSSEESVISSGNVSGTNLRLLPILDILSSPGPRRKPQ